METQMLKSYQLAIRHFDPLRACLGESYTNEPLIDTIAASSGEPVETLNKLILEGYKLFRRLHQPEKCSDALQALNSLWKLAGPNSIFLDFTLLVELLEIAEFRKEFQPVDSLMKRYGLVGSYRGKPLLSNPGDTLDQADNLYRLMFTGDPVLVQPMQFDHGIISQRLEFSDLHVYSVVAPKIE